MPRQLIQPPRIPTVALTDFEAVERYLHEITRYLESIRVQIGQELTDIKEGSATYNPPNLVDGAGVTTTVTVTGALLGDIAWATFSLDLQGITVTAWVSASGTVSVRFQNESGGALDLASGTLRAGTLRFRIV